MLKLRASKPSEVCSPNAQYPWEWVEFWQVCGEWRPVPKDAVIPDSTLTQWSKHYTKETRQKLKDAAPFI